jgi:iron complex outermembrane receptor protein
MKFVVSSRCAAAIPVLVAACSVCVAFAPAVVVAHTVTDGNLTPIAVTASRFPNDPAFATIGATVIMADDIRHAGIDNVNEAIRKLGGVYGRQSLTGSSDFSLDMRGFGSNGNQNLVILVDGVRLSENELATALLSSVPIDTVDRIEIVRGGGSVLYGDGATGGTIRIITRQPTADTVHGTVIVEVGDDGLRSGRSIVSKGWDGFALHTAYSRQHTDNYRDNNASSQKNFSGGAQWFSSLGRLGLRVDLARSDYGLAGALSMAQFLANPRQTATPLDHGAYDSDRVTVFFERRFDTLEVAAELSHHEKISRSSYGGSAVNEVHSRTMQFSPRLRRIVEGGVLKNELVTGLDFSQWQTGRIKGHSDAAQTAHAAYVRNELHIVENTRIAFGLRHEVVDKNSVSGSYDQTQGIDAWEMQASHAVVPSTRLFSKAGRSYRLPTADENGFTALATGRILKPQMSHDLEFGVTWGGAGTNATLTWFRHRLKDELFFDPTAGAFGVNVNLDPTRRQGVELEANARLNADFSLKVNFQHVAATFTDGRHAGKELVLVPKNTTSARLNWQSGRQTINLGVLWTDTQRYGNDFNNTCNTRMPSYATIDARYAARARAWEFALTGSNLTDKNYFSQAFGCASGIYPESGRALKFTARYDF